MKYLKEGVLRGGIGWLAAGVLAAGMAAGCSAVKTTEGGAIGIDRTQRMSPLVSEEELQAGAVKAYTEVITKEKSEGDLNADPKMTARVQAIAKRIIPQTAVFRPDAPKWKWEVHTLTTDDMNAYADAKTDVISAIKARARAARP